MPISSPEKLRQYAEEALSLRLTDLFLKEGEKRVKMLSVAHNGLFLDLSKQKISLTGWTALRSHALSMELPEKITAMFAGEKINFTEKRAVNHMAPRATAPPSKVKQVQEKLRLLANKIRDGEITNAKGEKFDTVISIGIGGSDLGPRLIWDALKPAGKSPIELKFIANIDPEDRREILAQCNPAKSLVIIVSKSFSTEETLANAFAVRDWLRAALGKDQANQQMIAISTQMDKATDFGIDEDRIFGFWDWVGGRFSLWSAVSMGCEIALGPDQMDVLRKGAAQIDEAVKNDPLSTIAAALALMGWWNRTCLGYATRAIFPYSSRLRKLADFLQQLEMESNGKSVELTGNPAAGETAPVTWGGEGTLAQHAVFQLLHQGTQPHPLEFITVKHPRDAKGRADHLALNANAIAQARALMLGKSELQAYDELITQGMDAKEAKTLAPHRAYPGDRPSSFLMLDRLDAYHLGALLATYEHKTALEGFLWSINSFDQFGVELGKVAARGVLQSLTTSQFDPEHDSSTRQLISAMRL